MKLSTSTVLNGVVAYVAGYYLIKMLENRI
jgi:hypothetical protein